TQRSAAELILNAQQAMQQQQYAQAVPLWRAAAAKLAAGDRSQREARYNLAVCLFQIDQPAEAAAMFLDLARLGQTEPLAEKAAVFAYRCRAQIAAASKSPADALALAEAGRVLLDQFPTHPEAARVAWVIPVALQEAGQYADARTAFLAIPSSSE